MAAIESLATDGGVDATAHVSDATIERAIAQHDDPDHPDATTVEEIRDLLATLQRAVAGEGWDIYMDHIEDGTVELVAETDGLLVLSTGEDIMYLRELEACYDGPADLGDDRTRSVLSAVMHGLARRYSDYDWGYSYPLVIRKPESFDAGRQYVEAHLAWLMDECGLSGGVALDYYMVDWRGYSQSRWASRAGKDQSTVSENVNKARQRVVR